MVGWSFYDFLPKFEVYGIAAFLSWTFYAGVLFLGGDPALFAASNFSAASGTASLWFVLEDTEAFFADESHVDYFTCVERAGPKVNFVDCG